MPHHEQLHHLLKDLSAIDYVYQKQRAHQQFNVFSVLLKASDEVRLHSRFLAELLDLNGSHMMGSAFLKTLLEEEYLKTINGDALPELNEVTCQINREKGNIDILIKQNNPKLAIVIENKIYADDQEQQLERYLNNIRNQGFQDSQIAICYLSLWTKDEPSEQSLGKELKKKIVNHLTYEGTIIQWLEKCIGLSAKKPALRESLIQYQNIVKRLTGQTMSNEQFNKVYELLKKDENILAAKQLADNWQHVKKSIELQFWQELETKVQNAGYQIIEFGTYDGNKLEKAHSGRTNNNNKECGLTFKIGEQYEGRDACIMIKRSWGPEVPVFYGLRLLESGQLLDQNEEWTDFGDLPSNRFFFRRTFHPGDPIYFDVFNETALQLVKDEERKQVIKNAWEEIEGTIQNLKYHHFQNQQ